MDRRDLVESVLLGVVLVAGAVFVVMFWWWVVSQVLNWWR